MTQAAIDSRLPHAPPTVPAVERFLELHAEWTRLHAEMLRTLAVIADDEGFTFEGQTGLVDWVVFETGAFRRTARAWVRTAERLEELPSVTSELASGRISFDHAAVAARFAATGDGATSGDDELFAELARAESADAVARSARDGRPAPPGGDRRQREDRRLRWWWDEHEMMHLDGLLPTVDGATVELALTRIAARAPRDPASGLFAEPEHRFADALVSLASGALADETTDHRPDLATVVVHIDASAAGGAARLDDGTPLGPSTIDRLLCDARLTPVAHAGDGSPLGVGRTTRRIPHWLRRILSARDRGCRFPGCGRTRHTHAHHIEHWAQGGTTSLDNLATLCRFHHHLVHEDGWRIEGDPAGALRVYSPAGHRVQPRRSYHTDDPDAEAAILIAAAEGAAAARRRAPP